MAGEFDEEQRSVTAKVMIIITLVMVDLFGREKKVIESYFIRKYIRKSFQDHKEGPNRILFLIFIYIFDLSC